MIGLSLDRRVGWVLGRSISEMKQRLQTVARSAEYGTS